MTPEDRTGAFDDRVAALSDPAMWPDRPRRVGVTETHLSLVFLTESRAYKLKKPVDSGYVDLRRVEARRRHCQIEIALNRRLAPEVYLRTVAMCETPEGPRIDPEGTAGPAIDWLVEMVRLPAGRMLDACIRAGSVPEAALASAAERLGRFYSRAEPVGIDGSAYRARLVGTVDDAVGDLTAPGSDLSPDRVHALHDRWRRLVDGVAGMVEGRATAGHIVEGHGDLRPEHICLVEPPAIIDCLEFSRDLRLLDPVAELALLEIECGRLDDEATGVRFREACLAAMGDGVPPALVALHRVDQALIRAKLAMGRRGAPGTGRTAQDWTDRANRYLALAEATL